MLPCARAARASLQAKAASTIALAGAASGAICAWSQGGGLTGLKPETNKDHAEYSDDEFHKDWMMNHKTDGFWKSEFSESVDVGCEKYSVD